MKQEIKEIWKDIPDYVGVYQVSDQGRVKSLERIVIRSNDRQYKVGERILKGRVGSSRYLDVGLAHQGEKKTVLVHHLVTLVFLNHVPNGHEFVVNHINRNIWDNRLVNLEIISNRKNTDKTHLKSTSKFVGVYFNRNAGKFQASIFHRGNQIYLGLFDCEIEASNAYQRKLKEILNETEI